MSADEMARAPLGPAIITVDVYIPASAWTSEAVLTPWKRSKKERSPSVLIS